MYPDTPNTLTHTKQIRVKISTSVIFFQATQYIKTYLILSLLYKPQLKW